jgi:hypothetical protein
MVAENEVTIVIDLLCHLPQMDFQRKRRELVEVLLRFYVSTIEVNLQDFGVMERRPPPKESGQRFTTFNQASNVRHLHLSLVHNASLP